MPETKPTFQTQINYSDFALTKLQPTDENAVALLAVLNENREFLGHFLEWVDAYTNIDKAKSNIAKSYPTDACSYFITIEGKIAGKIGFVDIDDNMGEISYWLARDYTGRGIMTRALQTLTKMGFDNLKLNRVQLTIDADNIASQATAERAGFVCEGVLHKYFLLRGVSRDMKMYAIVK